MADVIAKVQHKSDEDQRQNHQNRTKHDDHPNISGRLPQDGHVES